MRDEVLFERTALVVRRLRLEPGEAMPWHVDPHNRLSVVVEGRSLELQFRDGGDRQRVEVAPGQADWEEPAERPHRAINTGEVAYEEVAVVFLHGSRAVPQPQVE